MPELPEVETIRRDLRRLVQGCTVTRVRLLHEDMLVGGTPGEVEEALEGARISGIKRRGKALILRFSSGHSLIVHLRMTGQLHPIGPGDELPPYTRTVMDLEDGRRLVNVDTRRLGTLELVSTDRESWARTLANIGPDALTQPPAAAELLALLGRRRCAIKVFLLDQKRIAGIGNIYASEILARARIAPDTPCNELDAGDVRKLLRATRYLFQAAIAARGTTVSDYRTGTGETGGFQKLLRVYGREGKRCLRRGCKGRIRRTVQAQRSTYYCPLCQRR